jgi:hypothetical protein
MSVARKVIATAMLAAALAGCSSHSPSTPKASATQSTLSGRSFSDGLKAGESIAIPGETDGEVHANCAVTELQQMPSGDIKSRWMTGCFAGTILGMASADQSNGS